MSGHSIPWSRSRFRYTVLFVAITVTTPTAVLYASTVIVVVYVTTVPVKLLVSTVIFVL